MKYTSKVQQPNLAGESQNVVLSPLVVNKIYTNDAPMIQNIQNRAMKNNPHERKPMDRVPHKREMRDFSSNDQSLGDYFRLKYGFHSPPSELNHQRDNQHDISKYGSVVCNTEDRPSEKEYFQDEEMKVNRSQNPSLMERFRNQE